MFYINITIGKADNNNIVVKHPSISDNHGEISMFEDGRIVYEDFSTNGTIVGTKKIHKNSIDIRKNETILLPGENILPWAKIPSIPSEIKDAKAIYNIGREDSNLVRLSNTKTGRRHATIFVDKNGDLKIIDLSLHGTTVNGSKLPPYKAKPLKYGDKVVFANSEELNWKNIPRPSVNKSSLMKIIGSVALLVMIIFVVRYFQNSGKPSDYMESYKNRVGLIVNQHYVYCIVAGEPKFKIGLFPEKLKPSAEEGIPKVSTGTGFGVLDNRSIGTNNHVAGETPMDFNSFAHQFDGNLDSNQMAGWKNIVNEVTEYINSGLSVKLSDKPDHIYLTKVENLAPSELFLNQTKNKNKYIELEQINGNAVLDLILLKVKNGYELPKSFDYFKFDEISESYSDEGKEVAYCGYPSDTKFSYNTPNITPTGLTFRPGLGLQRNQLDFSFSVTCDINHGASGSPLFNGKGQLIGIVTHLGDANNTAVPGYCVEAKYFKELLK